jgi:hypothetical protein
MKKFVNISKMGNFNTKRKSATNAIRRVNIFNFKAFLRKIA